MAVLIAGLLIAGAAVAGVRGSRSSSPQAAPSASPASPAPTATESTPTPTPTATMTFSGLPPFEQTGTPSPASVSPTALLPHTGTDDSGFVPVAAMLFFAAALAGAALVRARDHRS